MNFWRKSMFCGFISITPELSLYLYNSKTFSYEIYEGNSVLIQLKYFVHILERDRVTGYFLILWNEWLWINWLLTNKWFATAPRSSFNPITFFSPLSFKKSVSRENCIIIFRVLSGVTPQFEMFPGLCTLFALSGRAPNWWWLGYFLTKRVVTRSGKIFMSTL